MEQVRTHTRWMSIKEYVKFSKQNIRSYNLDNKHLIKTRVHIFFT